MSNVKQTDIDGYRKEYYRYGIGFLIALAIVYLAYFSTIQKLFEPTALAVVLLVCATVQLVVQLRVFLHLGASEKKPKWKTWSFVYMLIIVLIFVGCSLWIMDRLNYNMGMSPEQMKQYMIEHNNGGF